MAASIIVGIDPGAHGAIAILDEDGQLLEIVDMPVTREASGRSATNAPLLATILAKSHARIVFCEFVAARPGDGGVGAFAFGRARGVIEGVCAAFDIPVRFIAPPVWKRMAGVPPGKENKDVARTKAIAKWPGQASLFKRKTDCDRADASLIGFAGLRLEIRTREVA
jgi:crossover junction endodeoxyribonuclease RuvC